MKQHIKIINIFLTACILLLGYKAASLVIKNKNLDTVKDTISRDSQDQSPKDIFKKNEQKSKPIFGSIKTKNESDQLPYKLTGTLVSDSTKSIAILEDLNNGKQYIYNIGDTIANYTLININQNDILLKNKNDLQKQLFLNQKKQPALEQSDDDIKKISASSWQIKESILNNSLLDINTFLQQVRIIPNFKNGNSQGFILKNIDQKSFLLKIGFQNGDILQAIDGVQINDPYSAIKALKSILLNSKSNITLLIERANQIITFSYKII